MPKVSIILPTFNRADTIMRAIRSVQAQSFQDWELVVVDDGSTDNTAALLAGIDARITLIRQENRGFTEARNTGIRAGSGDYFAFLDSDDEFMPHHLELCVAFLETFKEEQFISTELLEDFGHGRVVNHYRTETSDWYPKKAALIGSHGLDLPPGETDDYLRVYDLREPIVDWGSRIAERVDPGHGAFLYRGMIFEHIRYDFLITITATVMRSSVFAILGLPEPRWFTGSDFHFMARLCKTWRATFLSIPSAIKHEYADNGALPKSGHVVTGNSALRFATDVLPSSLLVSRRTVAPVRSGKGTADGPPAVPRPTMDEAGPPRRSSVMARQTLENRVATLEGSLRAPEVINHLTLLGEG